MTAIDLHLIRDILLAAIREDLGSGDITSRATVPEAARATGRYTTKQDLVVAGLPVVEEVVRLIDPGLEYNEIQKDGDAVQKGTVLAAVHGSARSVLAAERLTLNRADSGREETEGIHGGAAGLRGRGERLLGADFRQAAHAHRQAAHP